MKNLQTFKEFFLSEATEPHVSYKDYGDALYNARIKAMTLMSKIGKMVNSKEEPEQKTISGTTSKYYSVLLFTSKNKKYTISYESEDSSGRYGAKLRLMFGPGSFDVVKTVEKAKVTKDALITALKEIADNIADPSNTKYAKYEGLDFGKKFDELVK